MINGEKYFSSHADLAEFLITMAITDPDVPVHQGASMFLVPRGTPGFNIVRLAGLAGEPLGHGHHAYIRYEDCRVPADNLLGGPGQAFAIAQTRLGGGRIHHAMRTVAMVKTALRMMCERALSRRTQGEVLAAKQLVQQYIADSFIQLEQFRLLVLYTAWHIDKGHKREARTYIAAVKVQMAEVLHDVVRRAVQVHGAIGCSNELPLDAALAGGAGDGDRRRTDRGAQAHRRQAGAARLSPVRGPVAERLPARSHRRGTRPFRRAPGA